MSEETIPKGYWQAADGSLVPLSRISQLQKDREALVNELIDGAEARSNDLAQFKAAGMEKIRAFVQRSADEYDYTVRGAAGKGNVTLTSFDGLRKVEKAISDRVAFDERLQVAKGLFDEFVQRVQKGSNDTVKVLLTSAFRADKAGRVSVAALLKLRRAEINDPLWAKAVDALDACMHVEGSVAYIRYYKRTDTSKPFEAISLNSANV